MNINVIDKLDAKFNDEYSRLYIILGLVWSVCAGLDHATTDYALSTFNNIQELNPIVSSLGLELTLLVRIFVITIAIFGFMNMKESHSVLFSEKHARYIKFGGLGLLTLIFLFIVINNLYIIYVLSI